MDKMTSSINDAESGFLSMIGGGEEDGAGEGGRGGEEMVLKKGPWTAAEDAILRDYVMKHGEGNWNAVQSNTGLARCGKSCRLRWANHLRPNLKKGAFSPEEERLILEFHAQFGNKWAKMATLLPGRTDNEIKNYWNTRVKRRQRQGLHSDDLDHPTTSTTPTTSSRPVTPTRPTTSTATTEFEFFNQDHHHPLSPRPPPHSPLSSPLQHTPPYAPPHPSLDPTPFSSAPSPSPLFFNFQRPAPLHCSPLGFKRYRTSPRYNNIQIPPINPSSSLTTPLANLDGFSRLPVQFNSSSFSQIFRTPLESDPGVSSSSASAFPVKLELPSNQNSQPSIDAGNEIKLDMEFNDLAMQSSSGLLEDLLLEAQALASGQSPKKRSYFSLNEGNGGFDGCQGFDFEDLPLSSSYWSSTSGLTPKEEVSELNKSMNEDLSSVCNIMPSAMPVPDWHNNNSASSEVSSVQSSPVMPDDNLGHDVKPIASFFPLTTSKNHNENPSFCFWDNLPELG